MVMRSRDHIKLKPVTAIPPLTERESVPQTGSTRRKTERERERERGGESKVGGEDG